MSESVRVIAVGDIMLGDHPVCFGHGVRSTVEKNGGMSPFSQVETIFAGNDIVFGNIEAVLSDHGLVRGNLLSEEFRGAPEFLPMIQAAGFNVVSIANNHSMEHGTEAFWDTVNAFRGYGIHVAGLSQPRGRCEPVEITFRGCTVLILSYSLCPENYHKGSSVPYAHQQDFDRVLSEIMSFRGQADLLVVSLHWGYEYLDYPSPKQVLLAHRLIDEAGVSLIIGHHPHVLQGVERYHNGLIVYSLGNFVFDMWQKPTRESMILKVLLTKRGVESFEFVPVRIGANFQPEPLEGELKKIFDIEMEMLDGLLQSKCLKHDLGNKQLVDELESECFLIARRREMKHRLSSYVYFVKNIYKYEAHIIAKSALRSISRRLHIS